MSLEYIDGKAWEPATVTMADGTLAVNAASWATQGHFGLYSAAAKHLAAANAAAGFPNTAPSPAAVAECANLFAQVVEQAQIRLGSSSDALATRLRGLLHTYIDIVAPPTVALSDKATWGTWATGSLEWVAGAAEQIGTQLAPAPIAAAA